MRPRTETDIDACYVQWFAMIRIAITAAAFDAVAATLPFGSVGFEREPSERANG